MLDPGSLMATTQVTRVLTAIRNLLSQGRPTRLRKLIDTSAAETRLREHLTYAASWSDTVSIDPKALPRYLSDIYVDVDLALAVHDNRALSTPLRTVNDLHRFEDSFTLLGEPGAGKTTAVKHLLSRRLHELAAGTRLPIVVPLRALQPPETLIEHLCSILGIYVNLIRADHASLLRRTQLQTVADILAQSTAIVFLDGLDEVPTPFRPTIVEDIALLIRSCPHAQFVVTCRTAAYSVDLPDVVLLELKSLRRKQARQIATKWLSRRETIRFFRQLMQTPYSGAELRPLVLSVLLLLYLRQRDIPKRPKTVYERIIRLYDILHMLTSLRIERRSSSRPLRFGLRQQALSVTSVMAI